MASKIVNAVNRFLNECPYVVSLQDLLTKTRIELEKGYFLDIYYNETSGKYAYTLIKQEQRVVGWDNAPHHSQLTNFPHHFHGEDGTIQSSMLSGDPEEDIGQIVQTVNTILEQ